MKSGQKPDDQNAAIHLPVVKPRLAQSGLRLAMAFK
jgi:hypothetical protein